MDISEALQEIAEAEKGQNFSATTFSSTGGSSAAVANQGANGDGEELGAGRKQGGFIPRARGRGPHHQDRDRAQKSRGEVPIGLVIDKSTRVFIQNIPQSLIEAQGKDALRAQCEAFGEVDRYVLMVDSSGRYNGSAMCTYVRPEDAEVAIKAMHKATVEGNILEVCQAKNHGVHLLDQKAQAKKGPDASDTWGHDKFNPDAAPKPLAEDGDLIRKHHRRFNDRGFGRAPDEYRAAFRGARGGSGFRGGARGGGGRGWNRGGRGGITMDRLDAELDSFRQKDDGGDAAGDIFGSAE